MVQIKSIPSTPAQDVVAEAGGEDESVLEAPGSESVTVTDSDELPLSVVELEPASLV